MKILKYSGKLILTFIATSVIAFITMFMCLSADIEVAIKIIVGVFFAVFIMYMAWSSAVLSGEEDTKNKVYRPYKGFLAGLIAMTPVLIIAVAHMLLTFKGWNGENRIIADGVYMILYLLFISFTPILSLFVSFNPSFTVDFAQPAITLLDNITTPNAVSAPLFFIPIILFITVAGLGYIYGHKERYSLLDVVRKIKNNN